MEKTKIIGGALAVVGLWIAGYFGYKLYTQTKEKTVTAGLGAFADGYPDHNAKVASAYWNRQRELYLEQRRLRALGL